MCLKCELLDFAVSGKLAVEHAEIRIDDFLDDGGIDGEEGVGDDDETAEAGVVAIIFFRELSFFGVTVSLDFCDVPLEEDDDADGSGSFSKFPETAVDAVEVAETDGPLEVLEFDVSEVDPVEPLPDVVVPVVPDPVEVVEPDDEVPVDPLEDFDASFVDGRLFGIV
uniref:Uncharacterized protein n=1 Tax=Panagrolaimus davidi TaxID=227884 RepID=A0A914Q132_9BILA